MISETPLHALVARVVRRLDDWKDAEERYRSPRSDGRAWADLPKSIGAEFIRNQIASAQEELRSMRDELAALLLTAGPQEMVTSETSDGYHTFRELYDYRKVYNALLFNEWASQGRFNVHKARRHSDGEPCFGGGWFIVVAQTPCGQISNHYKDDDWTLFQVPERERGDEWDGHTPQVALERLLRLATLPLWPQETPRLRALLERATEFLAKGGLFNPELMEQAKATQLVLDMRDALRGVLVRAGAKEPAQ